MKPVLLIMVVGHLRLLKEDNRRCEVKGKWVYLYRAVDKEGLLCYLKSAMRLLRVHFFEKAIGSNGLPEKVTIDKSGANKGEVNTINLALALLCMFGGWPWQMMIRQIKYLNNSIEQGHRFVKKNHQRYAGF
jgi:putative transposase